MQRVVIADGVRTPIGRFQGALAAVRPDDLAARVLSGLVDRSGIAPDGIDEVVLGCANQAGEDNRNVARMATLLAGLPDKVPAVTVNRLCASGLEAVIQASRSVAVGDAALVMAGGVESMSRAPYAMPRGAQHPKAGPVALYDTALGWRFPNPAMAARLPLEQMGETAENVAERYKISREDQDAFAYQSHQRALVAQRDGVFASEIIPVRVPAKKGHDHDVVDDEGPRADSTLAKLGRLPAAFRDGGTVTAGNSSPLNDGAAAMIITTPSVAALRGLRVRAQIRASAAVGVDPRVMGIGPIPASREALRRAGLTVEDVDVWEINEAFAAQSLAVCRELRLHPGRVNVHGGAIALGHPLGCSGARILLSLLTVMERYDHTIGVATLCVGVGQGVAMVVERL